MARKGSHSKKVSNQSSSKSKKLDPELKVVADDLLGTSPPSSPLMAATDEPFPANGGVKNNTTGRSTPRKNEQVDGTRNVRSVHENDVSVHYVEESDQVGSHVLHVRNQTPESISGTFGSMTNGSLSADMLDKGSSSCHVALEFLRTYVMSYLGSSYEWLERQRPFFVSVTKNIQTVCRYVQLKLVQAYPVVLRWLSNVGNIIFLVSMIWLSCAFRGMGSFIRLETTSFVAMIWCSILSVIAMIGMFKFLLVLAVAALVGVLVSFAISLLITAVTGAVILWLCGSFSMTSSVVLLAVLAFFLGHERFALSIASFYSIYCAGAYVGWFGVLLAFNLSFITSDALIYFVRNNIQEQGNKSYERTDGDRSFFDNEAQYPNSDFGSGESTDCNAGVTSTSGTGSEITSEDEIVRLLTCTDHYSALGLSRYQQVDVSLLKREYRKKAILVHPDKNMGNEKAAEAFKKLQNAYEVLVDSLKRKDYCDELKREELVNFFCRFQSASQKNGRHSFFSSGSASSESDGKESLGESRRIACKKCGSFHTWFQTKKSKPKARWCQECNDFHQAKDGDGWVEQSSQPLFFGIIRKVDQSVAYVCSDYRVYDATEWFICQGMRCSVNSHKPSFHVNTSVTKANHGKGSVSSHRGGATASNMEESMTEEFFDWLQNAVQSGMFWSAPGDNPFENHQTSRKNSGSNSTPNSGGSSSKRKKKGKKQW